MPVQVGGLTYFTNNEVSEELSVSRQTLWRWREKGRIPVWGSLPNSAGALHGRRGGFDSELR